MKIHVERQRGSSSVLMLRVVSVPDKRAGFPELPPVLQIDPARNPLAHARALPWLDRVVDLSGEEWEEFLSLDDARTSR